MKQLILLTLLCFWLLPAQANKKNWPPADLEPYLTCPLTNEETAAHEIAGKQLLYRSSAEVDYATLGWETRVAASWNLLSEELLGTAGINIDNAEVTPANIPENARVLAIDIRRHKDQWVYHYFSNGTAFRPIENWSSAKIQAIFLAGLKIRHASGGRVGLDSTVDKTHMSQLIYRIANVSSNAPPAWFKTIMGAYEMTDYLNQWMNKSDVDYYFQTQTISEIFVGRFGVAPLELGGENTLFRGPDGESVTIRRNLKFGRDNTLSPLTMAESWKRIIAHQVDPATRPRLDDAELTDSDLRIMYYGHNKEQQSTLAGLLLGGTKKKIVEAMGGKALLDAKTNGKWRIFGKSGSGFSHYRKRHEAVFLGAACFPAAEGGIQQTRAFIFFVNIQALTPQRRYEIRDTVISNLTRLLVPELYSD